MRTVGPAVAGSWYPGNRAALVDLVDALFDKVGESGPTGAPDPTFDAVVAPHAGFIYSGQVAAHAIGPLRGRRVRRVIVIGPSHYAGFRGARLPDADAYATPLSDVPIEADVVAKLRDDPSFEVDRRPFSREHSLESELPFLQRALEPGWAVVPVLVGPSSGPADLDGIARALRPWADDGAFVVVSSDFTHYGRGFGYLPFTLDVEQGLERLDRGAIDMIVAGDAAGFEGYCDETGATICGRLAIGVLLRLWPEGVRARLLAYATAGRMTGDWSHSVSYAAIGATRVAA